MSTYSSSVSNLQQERLEVREAPVWRSRPAIIIAAILIVLAAIQFLTAGEWEVQEFIFFGYFLPVIIGARYFSRRTAILLSFMISTLYVLVFIPNIASAETESDELVIEMAARFAMFVVAGAVLSSFHLGIAKEKTRALKAERDRAQRLQLMLDVSNTVSSSLKIDLVLQILAERIVNSLGATFCRILLLDEKGGSLRVVAMHPVRNLTWQDSLGVSLPLSDLPDYRRALNTQEAVIMGGRRVDANTAIPEKQRELMRDAKSIMLYPLVAEDKAVGVVCIGEHRGWDRSPMDDDKKALLQTLVNQGAIAVGHAITHQVLEEAFLGTIRSLAEAIDAKDSSTRGHSDWVAKYALMIGRQINLDEEGLDALKFAGYLHDVGKIGIPDELLAKTSQLTAEEWQLMKKHPIMSAKILDPVPIAPGVKAAIRHHHERFDGKGYPYGLSGQSIPLEARIMAVADAYEAMISDRPYRKALSDEQAVAELKRCSGSQFDPKVVDAFLRALGRDPSIPCESFGQTEREAS